MEDETPERDIFDDLLFPEEHSQSLEIDGIGNTVGDITQIGSQHIYNGPCYAGQPVQQQPPAAEIETKWSWKSPLTQARLAWLGLFVSIVPIASLYRLAKPVVSGSAFTESGGQSSVPVIWIVGLLVSLVVLLAIVTMWRIVRLRIHALSKHWMLPAATEVDGRFAIARLHVNARSAIRTCGFTTSPSTGPTTPTSTETPSER